MTATQTVLFVLQWCLAAVGIVGNIWVIIAITQYNAIKSTANKIMFINLAVADLGVLIIRSPFFFLTHYYNNRWYFGDFTCKILMPISLTFMPASFLTLVVISYSRYRAIVYVKALKEMSVRITKYIVTFIWAFVIIFYPLIEIPVRSVNKTTEICDMNISREVTHALYAFEDIYFMLSFLAITLMFIRIRRSLLKFSKMYNDLETIERLAKNKHALKLLWPVVVALFITITPLMIGRIWYWVGINHNKAIPLLFYHVIDVLLLTNSAINPFIYIIVSTEFRHKLFRTNCMRVVRSLFAKPRRRNHAKDIMINHARSHKESSV